MIGDRAPRSQRFVRAAVGLGKACHPGPVAAVSAAAIGYALSLGCTRREATRVGLSVFAGQLAIGWQNDWTDVARDRSVRRSDKPIVNNEVSERLVGGAALLAAGGCVGASLATGRTSALAHLVAVASAAGYNAGLKATRASFAPYAVSFSLLPVFVGLSQKDGKPPPLWTPAAAGMLGVAAHLMNVVPDRELDRSIGTLGLPQRLSREHGLALTAALLACSSVLVTFGPGKPSRGEITGLAVSLALAAIAVVAARSRDDRSAFRMVLILALTDVAELLVRSKRRAIPD